MNSHLFWLRTILFGSPLHELGNPSALLLPTLSALESLRTKERCQEPSSAFLAAVESSSPDAASYPNSCLSAQLLTILGHEPSLRLTRHHPSATVYKTSPTSQSWWVGPFIPALRRQRQVDLRVEEIKTNTGQFAPFLHWKASQCRQGWEEGSQLVQG